jgi:WD40 repeat protein
VVGVTLYGTVFIWGVVDNKVKVLCRYDYENMQAINSITLLGNGWLATGSVDCKIRLWSLGGYVGTSRPTDNKKIAHFSSNIKMFLMNNQLRIEQVPLIFNKNIAKDLTSLDLSNTAINDQLLAAILDCCPRLVHIKYDGCSELTEVGKNMIAKRQKHLHDIIQKQPSNVTRRDDALPATTNTHTTKGWMPSYTTIAIAATALGVGAIITYGYKKYKKL